MGVTACQAGCLLQVSQQHNAHTQHQRSRGAVAAVRKQPKAELGHQGWFPSSVLLLVPSRRRVTSVKTGPTGPAETAESPGLGLPKDLADSARNGRAAGRVVQQLSSRGVLIGRSWQASHYCVFSGRFVGGRTTGSEQRRGTARRFVLPITSPLSLVIRSFLRAPRGRRSAAGGVGARRR